MFPSQHPLRRVCIWVTDFYESVYCEQFLQEPRLNSYIQFNWLLLPHQVFCICQIRDPAAMGSTRVFLYCVVDSREWDQTQLPSKSSCTGLDSLACDHQLLSTTELVGNVNLKFKPFLVVCGRSCKHHSSESYQMLWVFQGLRQFLHKSQRWRP